MSIRTTKSWAQFVEGVSKEPPAVRPLVLESWKRSHSAGIDPAPEGVLLSKVSEEDLRSRLEKNKNLVTIAAPLLKAFSEQHSALKHVSYLTDSDGIVLLSAGNQPLMLAYGLMPGYDWSEKTMGTNGAGTALATGCPVAVVGPEHYQLPFHRSTCLASPIQSAAGDVIGAVDFSTDVDDVRPEQLTEVIALAERIVKAQLAKLPATAVRGEANQDLA